MDPAVEDFKILPEATIQHARVSAQEEKEDRCTASTPIYR